eukprot:525766-Pyramimonas_sp.AAC.1
MSVCARSATPCVPVAMSKAASCCATCAVSSPTSSVRRFGRVLRRPPGSGPLRARPPLPSPGV